MVRVELPIRDVKPFWVNGLGEAPERIASRNARTAPAAVEVVAEISVLVRIKENIDGKHDTVRALIFGSLHQCLHRFRVAEIRGEEEIHRPLALFGQGLDRIAYVDRLRANRGLSRHDLTVRPEAGFAA